MSTPHHKGISPEEVEHIARLSRIELREGDREKFNEQLSSILDYVATLQEMDTEAIDPTFLTAPLFNVLRKDEPWKSLSQDEVLANAPDREGPFFKMPRILDTEGIPDF